MNLKIVLTVVAVFGLTAACQKAGDNSNVSANQSNKTAVNSNKNETANTAANTSPTGVGTTSTGSMATPTDTYKAAYAARQKKDIATLKKIFSKDILEFFAEMGKDENKSIDDELKEMCESPQGPTDETRNEKITGDTATIEYKKDKDSWQTMDFVKEDGSWKMTLPKMPKGPDKPGKP